MSFQIGDTVGDYQIIDILGAGGMGKVYKVRNQISDRIDALKVLLPSFADNQDLADRFIREIKVLASLNHPNIAGLRTAFRVDNQLLMLMEFVEGKSLDKDAKGAAVSVQDGVGYIRQVLAALDYAHDRGVIHRDIKPANMMLTPEGVIKLMDFGIAKSSTDQKLTQTGMIVGSLYYMSPEQVRGTGLDNRSDLYSVGVSLYEFVTGSRPFKSGTDFDIMMAQLQQVPQAPMERLPGLPRALNDIIMKSLEKNPADRFQSAAEFSAALSEICPAQGMTSFQASHTAALAFPSGLAVTRKQSTAPADMSSVQPPTSPSPEQSVAPSAQLNSPPPVAEKPPSQSNFLLPIGIGVGLIAVFAVIFLVLHHPQKTETTVPPVVSHSARTSVVSFPSGDMVLVDGGDALLGPQLKSTIVGPFYIDKTEVSNRAYLNFSHATSHMPPVGIDQAPGDDPVVNVSYDDAQSFCGWATKRLPTADEWEKAARGSRGQLFPWGSSFDVSMANLPRDEAPADSATLAPVTAYPSGKSPYGALNMMGNVWEWVNRVAPAPTGAQFRAYQQMFRDLSPPISGSEPYYYARGGSFKFPDSNPAELISDPGSPLPARAKKPDVGFRCAMDPKN